MSGTDSFATLTALNEGLIHLQRSARRTIPMFVLGILATLIAAAAAVYYIVTLSAALRDANAAVDRSNTALTQTQAQLAAVTGKLREAQKTVVSPAAAQSIATAISDVSKLEANITTASNSVTKASTNLDRLEADDHFVVVPTSDHFLSLRAQPSITSSEIRRVPTGGVLRCGEAAQKETGGLWRPCKDDRGNSGFVSAKYVRAAGSGATAQPGNIYEVLPTSDHFLMLRAQPSIVSSEIRKITTGGVLQCGDPTPDEAGMPWRPCTDDQGNSGFVSNKYIRKL